MILGCEGRLIYTGGILGLRKLGPIGNRRGRFIVQEQVVEGAGNMCTCIYCVLYCCTVVLYCFVYVYLFLSVLSVLV